MLFENICFLDENFEAVIGNIEIENGMFGKIEYMGKADRYSDIIVPGFVDIHIHGAVGHNLSDDNADAARDVSDYLLKHGTTAFLPTFSCLEKSEMISGAKRICAAAKQMYGGARICGIHLEGPYINIKKCGGMNPNLIRKPDIGEFEEILSASENTVRLVCIAPEIDGADEFIKKYKDKITISMGHTDAGYREGMRAISKGVTDVTHTFNAMRPLHHRTSNMLSAAFESNIKMEIIADGYHVSPEMVRLAYMLCGRDRLVFITDSVSAAGKEDGIYREAGLSYSVKNGRALMDDGTIYGGTSTLLECVKNAVSWGFPFGSAVKCATLNPCETVGIANRLGSITEGKFADFLVLGRNLNLKQVYISGKRIY